MVNTVSRAPRLMPGPARIPISALPDLTRRPPFFFARMSEQYGPFVRVPVPGRALHLVSDPEAIQEVLVTASRFYSNDILPGGRGRRQTPLTMLLGQGLLTSDGDLHRRQRRLIQPLFHRQRIASYTDSFVRISRDVAMRWRDGAEVDMLREMVLLTLAVVTRTIFDVSIDSRVADTIRTAMPRNDGPLRYALMPAGQMLARLPLPSNIRFWRGRAALDEVVFRLISERRLSGARGGDLLSLLLQARDAGTGEPMDDRQVRDEALTLLMAGHDTDDVAPLGAIQAGTLNGAKVLGWQGQIGALKPGMLADIVAVSGNPLVDIKATSDAIFVMRSGTVYKNDRR